MGATDFFEVLLPAMQLYDQRADLNEDEKVNASDHAIMLQFFDSGPGPGLPSADTCPSKTTSAGLDSIISTSWMPPWWSTIKTKCLANGDSCTTPGCTSETLRILINLAFEISRRYCGGARLRKHALPSAAVTQELAMDCSARGPCSATDHWLGPVLRP